MKFASLFTILLFVMGCTTPQPALNDKSKGPFTIAIVFEGKPLLNTEIPVIIEIRNDGERPIECAELQFQTMFQKDFQSDLGLMHSFVLIDHSQEKTQLLLSDSFAGKETKTYRTTVKSLTPGYYAFVVAAAEKFEDSGQQTSIAEVDLHITETDTFIGEHATSRCHEQEGLYVCGLSAP